MPVSKEYLDYVQDLLSVLGPVDVKRMFGGAGLYHKGVFFGLVADEVLYFKVDEVNKQDYLDAGAEPFKPFGTYAMGYYEVPADVLEDQDLLKTWAERAFAVAMRSPAKKSGHKKRGTVKKRSR